MPTQINILDVRHDLIVGIVHDLRRPDEDGDQPDEVHVEGDDPRRATDEEVDESW
jgi:hypothetical protein